MAHLQQERHTHVVSDTIENFVLTSTMIDAIIPAQLPHLNIFVIKIADTSDAKQDSLARVARISDLLGLPIGRDAALAAIAVEYLSAQSVLTYTDLSTAVAGATAVKDRVSQLVSDWIKFQTSFNAPDPTPAIITIPTTDVAQLPALIADYTTKKQARYQAQLAKTASDDALTRANASFGAADGALTTVQLLLTGASGQALEMINLKSYLDSLVSSGTVGVARFENLITSGNAALASSSFTAGADKTAFQAAVTIAVGDKANLQAAVNAAINAQVLASGYVGDAAAHQATVQAYVTALTASRTAAQSALTAATSDTLTKAQTVTNDQAAEAAALAAVIAVCPDFDSHSIPFVPDV